MTATAAAASAPAHIPDDSLAEEAAHLVRRWLAEAAEIPAEASATRLADVLRDPRGLEFTVGFIDKVIRPEDAEVAAANLAQLARQAPRSLSVPLRTAVRLGGLTAPRAPRVVMPVVNRVLRRMVGHLLVDARDAQLGRAISELRRPGVRLNINLLGEAVLGEREALRRLKATTEILARPDVDYVSVKVSTTVAPHSPWAFDETVHDIVGRLRPLFELAHAAPTPKFINLDMEEYRDLDLTLAVFTDILDTPALLDLEAGIVLQAYLPDALGAMQRLQEWAAQRRERGGAGVKVRVVKGANLPMERVEASLHGWPLATWDTKVQTDANYKLVLDYALEPDRLANVRIGVAGHNLFDIAWAWLLAGQRGARAGMDVEMLLGMATGQAEVVRREVGSLILYTPVVAPDDFDVAIAYLVRRLEEGASHENFMSAVHDLAHDEQLFQREQQRFLDALAELPGLVPAPKRQQDRERVGALDGDDSPGDGFRNTQDTDPALPANRRWGRALLERAPASTLGLATVEASTVTNREALDAVLADAVQHGGGWGRASAAERATVLERAARSLESRRADLVEVMAAEAGKTLDQSDPEVSEAVDFAAYYAGLARELDAVDGARFVPVGLTVVAPPWNFPVAIPAGSTLAALAAGSAVVLKPAPQVLRCAAVLADALWAAGVPRDALQLVVLDEGQLGAELIADPRVDRVILTGAYETAELFRSFRRDLPLLAETSGKNAIVVTPSADYDLAVKDIVSSAFGHAGQKCSATSLAILVGSVAHSRRFREQLVDAVTSLAVGSATDPTTRMGPLIEPATGKALEGLTQLGPGESWLVQPRQLDAAGRSWRPGVRTGVAVGSSFHRLEYFVPVLGLMTADSMEEAIELQNAVDYGLTAGLHSLDPHEIGRWLDGVQAGNLYLNRGTTGAIVRRQPFGGWKRSTVGAGAKAGGPNYLIGLGDWEPRAATADDEPAGAALELMRAMRAIEAVDAGQLSRGFASDARAWAQEFGRTRDVSGLMAERNLLRYQPVPVAIRQLENAPLTALLRVIGAGLLAGAPLTVSSTMPLPEPVAQFLRRYNVTVVVDTVDAWHAGLHAAAGGRVRLVGDRAACRKATTALTRATAGRPDLAVFDQPVTEAGRIELLPFLREQAVSITAHRFGSPDHLTDALI